MATTKIQISNDGPSIVSGDFEVSDGEGNVFVTEETVYLCRCGLSQNKPFCDGAHQGKFESTVKAK